MPPKELKTVQNFDEIIFRKAYESAGSSSGQLRKARSIMECWISLVNKKKSIGAVTMLDVSKSLDLPRTTIHNYFKTKTSLSDLALKFIRIKYQEYVILELKKAGQSPKDLIEAYVQAALRWPKTFPNYVFVWISFLALTSVSKEKRLLNTTAVDFGTSRLAVLIEAGKTAGLFSSKESSENLARHIQIYITGKILSDTTEERLDEQSSSEMNAVRFCLSILGA